MRVVWWLLAIACSRSSGVPDDQLGTLVIAPRPAAKIDVAQAVSQPDEFARALALPHSALLSATGPHRLVIDSKTVIFSGGQSTSLLIEHSELAVGNDRAFHGVYTNSADYGRETIFTGGRLYLRPRYQRWHGRAPDAATEPDELRDNYFAQLAAVWELVAPGAELTDLGPLQVAGRAGRKIEVKLAPTPAQLPSEPLTQRKWRELRAIERLVGTVVLDADSGVPLAAQLSATIGFANNGQQFTMAIELDYKVTAIGATAIDAPPLADVVATPERKGEVEERDYLLRDIAPPVGKRAQHPVSEGSASP